VNANGIDADSINEFCSGIRLVPTRPGIVEILSHITKILDKSTNIGVTSPSVFVGARSVLYMKPSKMATKVRVAVELCHTAWQDAFDRDLGPKKTRGSVA
jgi:hypothetical protein